MSDRDYRDDDRGEGQFKCWFGGLSWDTTESTLRSEINHVLGRSAHIVSCKIVLDHDTGRSKGFAFVGFDSPDSVEDAMDKMNDMMLDGRRIVVKRATARTQNFDRALPASDRRGRSRSSDRRYRSPDRRGRSPDRYSSGRYGGSRPGDSRNKPAYRVSVSGLPDDYTWRELKDFLRAGSLRISYAAITRPGYGVGDYDTEDDREDAIRRLDRKELESGIIRLKYDTHPRNAPASERYGGRGRDDDRDYDRGRDRDRDRGRDRDRSKDRSRDRGRDRDRSRSADYRGRTFDDNVAVE